MEPRCLVGPSGASVIGPLEYIYVEQALNLDPIHHGMLELSNPQKISSEVCCYLDSSSAVIKGFVLRAMKPNLTFVVEEDQT